MALTTEQLLSIARNYWPGDMDTYLRPETSVFHARFEELSDREFKRIDEWRAFVRALRGELTSDLKVCDITAPGDGCFRCAAYFHEVRTPPNIEWVVVGCVSMLAPVYTIYGVQSEYRGKKRIRDTVFYEPLPLDMQAIADVMARGIRVTFGVEALPREIAETRVPLFVFPVVPPDTTLFHAFFISRPERVP
jgi:hypothetical protein